jgi:MFS family permease
MSAGLFGSFASRDFALAYTFRLLMFIAQFSINNYLLYILQDMIGAANLPSGEARIAAGALNSLRTVATVATILFATWLAHRTQQRRIFAQVYAVLMAAAMLIPALSPTWPGMLAFGILGGVAIGCYSVIDLTLMSRVLPNPNSAGRDIALLVMAGASAQMVAPVFGGICIRWFGYDSLFEAAAFVTLLAGGVMSLIRGVR